MINKVDKVISYHKELVEKLLKTKIEGNLLDNKEFQKFLKTTKEMDSINPKDLMKIYKQTDVKIKRFFKCNDEVLEIDPFTINFTGKKISYFYYTKYKSSIISKQDEKITERHKIKNKLNQVDKDIKYKYYERIEKLENDVNKLDSILNSDIDLVTYVKSIKLEKNNRGLIKKVIVDKKYILDLDEVFNKDEFNERYSNVLETIDGNYVVNTALEPIEVDYCAHTDIDAVYGLEGKWGLVDLNDNFIIEPKYIYPFIECGDNLQVMLPERIEDNVVITLKHGLIDTKGNIIIPIKYLYMEAMDNSGEYFRVVDPKTYKSGVLDKNNKIVIPFKYDYIQASPDLELCETNKYCSRYPDYIYQVKVCNNDLYGVYDLKLEKEIIKPKYKYLKIVGYNKFKIGDDYDNCNILIDEKER